MTRYDEFCQDVAQQMITNDEECENAASTLNITYGGTTNAIQNPKGCFIEYSEEFPIKFNNHSTGIEPDAGAEWSICKAGIA